jgi:hypothetical protein
MDKVSANAKGGYQRVEVLRRVFDWRRKARNALAASMTRAEAAFVPMTWIAAMEPVALERDRHRRNRIVDSGAG